MRDLFRVRAILGLSVFDLEEKRLLYEACLYAGKETTARKDFVSKVLELYLKHPQSEGKRLKLKRLIKKVLEIKEIFHMAG